MAKIENNDLILEENEISLAALFRRLWRATDVKCHQRDLGLVFKIDPQLPETCRADEMKCYQAVENLLSNAVKYTEKGGVEFSAGKDEKGRLKMQVRDTGIGIPEESLGKIFHRFEQLDTENRRYGLGLGLEITNSLVKLMGGQIEVESEVGKGSCFTVFLPVKFISERPIGKDWNREEDTVGRERLVYRCDGRRILVVDDNEMNRRVIYNYLKNTGIHMDEARSGEECLEKLTHGASYDLLLLDHMMPGMDGIELFRRIAALDSWRAAPCSAIAMTANAVKGARQMYLSEGFDDYLPKPIDAESLYLMLKEYLGGTVQTLEKRTGGYTGLLAELEAQGMDLSVAKHYADDSEEFLMEELALFAGNSQETGKKLEKARAVGDREGMAVYVHGLKNNLATLGFTELAKEAKNLEMLLREEETESEALEAAIERFLGEYAELAARLRKLA